MKHPRTQSPRENAPTRRVYLKTGQVFGRGPTVAKMAAEVAERMGTHQSAVARLEAALAAGKHSPSIATFQKYAKAVGRKLDIRFVQK